MQHMKRNCSKSIKGFIFQNITLNHVQTP